MCQDCWESYGSHRIDTPAVREAARLIETVYDFSCVGGNLHIVTDDWNLDDSDLDSCPEWIDENSHGAEADQLEAEQECLTALRSLSEEELVSAVAIHWGFWKPEPDPAVCSCGGLVINSTCPVHGIPPER